jgi:hypothetical protein
MAKAALNPADDPTEVAIRKAVEKAEKQIRRSVKTQLKAAAAAATPPPSTVGDDQIISVPMWCKLVGISEATGRTLLRLGQGPEVVRLSNRRVGISGRAHREWLSSRSSTANQSWPLCPSFAKRREPDQKIETADDA